MTDIVFGEPIEVNGKRPEWLGDDEPIVANDGDSWYGFPVIAGQPGWESVETICLPADHFAYLAIAKGFEPTSDNGAGNLKGWDKGDFLYRDKGGDTWTVPYDPTFWPTLQVIGYRKKAPAAEEVPDWAVKRAESLFLNKGAEPVALQQLARYIAMHEEPPVDPLVEALREAFGDVMNDRDAERLRKALASCGLEIVEKK